MNVAVLGSKLPFYEAHTIRHRCEKLESECWGFHDDRSDGRLPKQYFSRSQRVRSSYCPGCKRCLRVKINSNNAPPLACQLGGDVAREVRLPDAAFLVCDGYH